MTHLFHEFFLVLFGAALAGVGWLIKRWTTKAKDTEDVQGLMTVVGLHKVLREEGLSMEEAVRIREGIRSGKLSVTPAIADAIANREPISGLLDEAEKTTDFYNTTVGMKLEAGMRFEKLNAELALVISEFTHSMNPERFDFFEKSQKAWVRYRECETSFTASLWSGGSGAPLLGLARSIEITEQRIDELKLQIAEEAAL
ncbi:lysozyme inhibitor LprI family protein [Aurantiacibacter sp. MUD61]|uniref:lysozyme inhibitor LprI family protein n=1 Tax=Aurantiacibacter sp. MUD61 TaxID=3009083 RepID=UPI0022F1423A|nr:lysozyme inhibitor LprI family protein [Aurantiacibacter sp. MUD61]